MKRVLAWIALAIPLVLLGTLLVGYFRSDNSCSDPGLETPRIP